jgi:hypothetical protein
MLSAERATERPAPIRLPPAHPNSSINLISDEPTSPARPRSATVSPSIVARKHHHEDKIKLEEERRPSLPAAAHRLQTPWTKKEETQPPRIESEGPRRPSVAAADPSAARALANIPAIEAESSLAMVEGEAPRRHSDTPVRSLPEGQPVERKKSMTTAASISCAYCTATGVNSTWRRDRSGKPLCGRCCEQLRRRMNPRQVSLHQSFLLY